MKVNQRTAEATVFTRTLVSLLLFEVCMILSHQEQGVMLVRSQKRNDQNLIVSGYSQDDDVWCRCCANLDTRLHGKGCLQVTLTLAPFQLDLKSLRCGERLQVFRHLQKRGFISLHWQWGRRPNPQHT